MTAVDWVAMGIVLVSSLAGLMRGFVREVASVAAWVLAFVAAKLLAPYLAPLVPGVESEPLRYVAAIVAIFVVVLMLVGLGAVVLSGVVRWAGLGTYDKFFGLIFGGLRAMLILLLLTLLAGLTSIPKTETWRNSISHGWFEAAAVRMKPWLPADLAALIQYH